MLNKEGILKAIEAGDIYVGNEIKEDYSNDGQFNQTRLTDEGKVGDGFVYVTLAPKILVYKNKELYFKKKNDCEEIFIPEEGLVLEPGKFYLGTTQEYTLTKNYVPKINGLPGLSLPGVYIHITAGFGDNGFAGNWTLEICAAESGFDNNYKPVLKSGQLIGILQYDHMLGNGEIKYEGKYLGQTDVTASRSYQDTEDMIRYRKKRGEI